MVFCVPNKKEGREERNKKQQRKEGKRNKKQKSVFVFGYVCPFSSSFAFFSIKEKVRKRETKRLNPGSSSKQSVCMYLSHAHTYTSTNKRPYTVQVKRTSLLCKEKQKVRERKDEKGKRVCTSRRYRYFRCSCTFYLAATHCVAKHDKHHSTLIHVSKQQKKGLDKSSFEFVNVCERAFSHTCNNQTTPFGNVRGTPQLCSLSLQEGRSSNHILPTTRNINRIDLFQSFVCFRG